MTSDRSRATERDVGKPIVDGDTYRLDADRVRTVTDDEVVVSTLAPVFDESKTDIVAPMFVTAGRIF